MFEVLKDKTICLTRGDIATIEVSAKLQEDGKPPEEWLAHKFSKGDIVRFSVFKRQDCTCVEIQKDVAVEEDTENVAIFLSKEDTKIGDPINFPTDYRYEIVANPDTMPQTIVGYDKDGEKIFRLYPEGSEKA